MKWKHLREEIHAHIEEKALELIEAGVAENEAWEQARREFGNPELTAEAGREVWGWIWIEDFFKDLRYAFRTMFANRAFTALAVTSLALGIGANTAVYSFMDSILLRSLPVKDPESLVVINWHTPVPAFGRESPTVAQAQSGVDYADGGGTTASILPYPAVEALQKSNTVFSSFFAFRFAGRLNVTVKGEAGVATGEYVSGDYFRGLGVSPAAGRMLIAEDDSSSAMGAAVVSFAFSQKRFGEPASAVGQTILVNNVALTVVGVTPPEFFGVQAGRAADVFLPMLLNPRLDPNGIPAARYLDQHYYWINTMARLNPGVSLDQAQSAMAAPFRNWAMSTATTDLQRKNLPALLLKPGATGLEALRRRFSKPLYVLMTLVGFILVIACANIANLLLARAAGRRREMAVRLSIGAGRLRVIRQLLTESVVMASIGGALGVLVAIGGIRLLSVALADGREPFMLNADLNLRVLAVTAGVTLLTGILFGLAPAIQSTRVDVMPALKEIRAGEARSRRGVSLSQVLVSAQIALSLLMLVAAGLFLRTLMNLQSVELGFDRENVLLFEVNARQAGHGDTDIARFYEDLQAGLRTIPGVRGVSLSHEPLIQAGSAQPIHLPGAQRDRETRYLYTGADFFKTMQIPMLAGREFEDRDQQSSPQVAVVSEQFARKNFGKENPVGRRLVMEGRDPRDLEIIGVAKEAHYGGLKSKVPPVVYIPYAQGRQTFVGQMTFVMRTSGDPFGYLSAVRDIVRRADARVPLANIKTQTALIDESIYQELAFAKLCAAFALLALVVACVGLYGTVSYQVARRTGEIGIRMALGARRAGVAWMVLREVLVLAGVALGISVPLALALSGLVASFLYGMKPNDPAAFAAAVAALVCAALVAAYVPARRAARIDPMVALRHE
jgi:macrolide transport system ATP-binding/permease protein